MANPVYIELTGRGRPMVFLHGWGMHAGIFQPLAAYFSRRFTVAAIDLPGHGKSAVYNQFAELSQHTTYLAEALSGLLKEGAILVGWSMGGLLAQSIAIHYPQYVYKLVLFCSTPRFVKSADWQNAVAEKVLSEFAEQLQRNYHATLSRFLSLQFLDAANQKQDLRKARELLFSRPLAQGKALQQGLALLESSDLRSRLNEIRCPSMIINGERDTLIPTMAGRYLAEHITRGRCVIFKGAGHAPFLSHHILAIHYLERFINEC